MADRQFRLRSIGFDAGEEVAEVAAAVTGKARELITTLVGELVALPVVEGGELVVILPVADALKLFAVAGQTRGTDPDHEILHEVYNSLSVVVYGLIES